MIQVFQLWPRAPLLVQGGLRSGLFARSDTLSAALVSLWKSIDPSCDLSALAASPPFRVSSLLPLVPQAGTAEVFLPLPPGALSAPAGTPGKREKRVLFASRELLRKTLSGQAPTKRFLSPDDLLASTVEFHEPFATSESRLRLAVDRETGGPIEGQLFEADGWRVTEGHGFALLADLEEAIEPRFRAALELLGHEGLGSERSSGFGAFKVKAAGMFPEGEPTGDRILVSLCWPGTDEVARGALAGTYTLVERGGWVTAPGARTLRRGRVRMLAEGSRVPFGTGLRAGGVALVQEAIPALGLNHPIYRDGRALCIAV